MQLHLLRLCLISERNERAEKLLEWSAVPVLSQPLITADSLRDEVEFSTQPELEIITTHALLLQFYKRRKNYLLNKKFKHFMRWTRYGTSSESVETLHPVFNHRMNTIEEEYLQTVDRIKRLEKVLSFDPNVPKVFSLLLLLLLLVRTHSIVAPKRT
jgi:hypothetical protein